MFDWVSAGVACEDSEEGPQRRLCVAAFYHRRAGCGVVATVESKTWVGFSSVYALTMVGPSFRAYI